MAITTVTDFRKNLNKYMAEVNDNADALHVVNTANPAHNVVVLSELDYERIAETLYIYQQPQLARIIRDGLQDARDRHNLEQHSLIED